MTRVARSRPPRLQFQFPWPWRLKGIETGILYGLGIFFSVSGGWATNQCQIALGGQNLDFYSPREISTTPITDFKSLTVAITEGLLLHSHQASLFEIYRKQAFGEPNTSLGIGGSNQVLNLNYVNENLKAHPNLQKPQFREYEVEELQTFYSSPPELDEYVNQLITNAQQIRTRLFQIEQNLPFWRDLLRLQFLDRRSQLPNKEKNQLVFRYLTKVLKPENIERLKSKETDFNVKSKILFDFLEIYRKKQLHQGRALQQLGQNIVELAAIAGFNELHTLNLLKSSNGLDKLKGLTLVYNRRSQLAEALGFPGHFTEMMSFYNIKSSVLNLNPDTELEKFNRLRDLVLNNSTLTGERTKFRIRSLSIQESPFRSCLGGDDCSSRTYPLKALDPNYIYFTQTDMKNHSSGHTTLVLGEGKDSSGGRLKMAFLDKLQNVPTTQIKIFLEGVRRSVAEEGYVLGIPIEVGSHNGLSNQAVVRDYVEKEILPSLGSQVVSNFTPHSHEYEFPNKYSRAYERLSTKIFRLSEENEAVIIRPGRLFTPLYAPKELSESQIVNSFLKLKDSPADDDQLKFIGSYNLIPTFAKYTTYTQEDFLLDLKRSILDQGRPFKIRRVALLELITIQKEILSVLRSLDYSVFTDSEWSQITSDLSQWTKSNDLNKRKYIEVFQNHLIQSVSEFIKNPHPVLINYLIMTDLLDVSQIQIGYQENNLLMHLIKLERDETVQLLLQKKTFHLAAPNQEGHSVFFFLISIYKEFLQLEIEPTGSFGFGGFFDLRRQVAIDRILKHFEAFKTRNPKLWRDTYKQRVKDYLAHQKVRPLSETKELDDLLFFPEEAIPAGESL